MEKVKQKKIYIVIEVLLIVVIIGLLGLFIFKIAKPKEEDVSNNNNEVEEVKKVTIIDEESKTRPIAIMINNAADARPYQQNLQQAYIVYEMINYSDGSTRFLALFKDKDLEEVGPIRSARHYHLDYVLENDAIFIHWGYSPKAQSDIKTLGINNINGITYGSDNELGSISDKSYFWTKKISGVNIAHRRFTNTNLINKAIERLKYRVETEQENLLKYSVSSIDTSNIDGRSDAKNVAIYYAPKNYVGYEYDEESKTYLRSVKGIKHVDASTGDVLKVKNIITYKIENTTIPGDSEQRQDLHNIGSGDGFYITEGYAMPIKWEKECRECQTKYTYTDGSEVIFNDGNTFIQINPTSEEVKIS